MSDASYEDLIQELAILSRQHAKPRGWIDRTNSDVRRKLAEVRKSFHDGSLKNCTVAGLHKACCEKLGIKVGITQFTQWLKNED